MPTRFSLFSLISAGLVAASQGPFTSSLVHDPDYFTPMSTGFTTIFTTVITTVTILPPRTTITISPSVSTTTLFVSSPLPVTTTVYSSPQPPSSSNGPTNVQESPMESGAPFPAPTHPGSGSITQNPGALAGLIIGVCVLVAGLAIFTWFTINRHRLRELENQALDAPPISAVRYSTSAGDAPPGNSHRVVEDDPDLEIQSSSIGHEVRPSSIGLGIGPSFSGFLGYGESREQPVDHEVGYYVKEPTVASSNGHSSHGNGTIMTRNSSLTHVTGTRNTSPTLPRQSPNRRFTLNPQRGPLPSAWQISRSEAPTRRASIDDASYHPHRVNSDPVVFYDAPPLMSVYPRRQSSEVPRHETFQLPGPIVVHPPLPHPPSSLLRPPSATQIPTIESLQRSSEVYLGLPSVNEPAPSPATSNISILPMREHLLGTPPNHPSSSAPSLRDDYDYCRPLSVGVVGALRDSMIMADTDSDSEIHPNRDSAQRRSTLR